MFNSKELAEPVLLGVPSLGPEDLRLSLVFPVAYHELYGLLVELLQLNGIE